MKRILLATTCIVISCFFFSFKKIHSGGEIGATGSPGETTCANCHGGGAAGTTISITAVPAFSNNNYVPLQGYTVTITVSHPTQPAFGFNGQILNSGNTNAGTMSNAGSGVQIITFAGKTNATHTAKKFGSGSASFSFNWTAPASGNAIFYVSGNAVNNSNNTLGDSPANTSMTLTADPLAGLYEDGNNPLTKVSVYPNPACDLSAISYFLQRESDMQIDLMQLDGKPVKTLLHEQQSPGPHNHLLDLKEIPKGVYFLKLSASGETLSQKMLLLR